MLSTVVLQFALHFATLTTLVDEAHRMQAIFNVTANATADTNASNASDASVALASAANVSVNTNATGVSVGSNATGASTNATSSGLFFEGTKPFQPNLVNTVVYLLGVLLQLITFTVNYKVHMILTYLCN